MKPSTICLIAIFYMLAFCYGKPSNRLEFEENQHGSINPHPYGHGFGQGVPEEKGKKREEK